MEITSTTPPPTGITPLGSRPDRVLSSAAAARALGTPAAEAFALALGVADELGTPPPLGALFGALWGDRSREEQLEGLRIVHEEAVRRGIVIEVGGRSRLTG